MSIPTITIPVLSSVHLAKDVRQPKLPRWTWLADRWLVATCVTAMLASLVAWYYSYTHHMLLLYADAHSHLDIARRVFDSYSPGLAQLGGVWLPLPHLIMVPLIWNDMLWREGLAGSFTSMACFVGAAIYLYMGARRLTHDGSASFVGALVFILNPNILYMQTTPMSELILIFTMTAACYYLLGWAQDDHLRQLTFAAGATFLATLARYDGWALYLAGIVAIILIGWRKRHSFGKIQGNVLLFAALGGLGIALWFLWCVLIFKDPLYFQRGPYAAQTQQSGFITEKLDLTYHNLGRSLHDYTILAAQNVGPILLIIAMGALLLFLMRNKLGPESWTVLVYCVPFAFYVVSLYGGQGILFTYGAHPPQMTNPLFNTRYGTTVVAPVAMLIATLAMRWPLGKIALIGAIIGQTFVIAHGGIITLQDGQYGISCFHFSTIPVYLAQHHDGGYILDDSYSTAQDFSSAGVPLNHVIYQGSGKLWEAALLNPSAHVEWIVIHQGDEVSRYIDVSKSDFLNQYALVNQDVASGVQLYHSFAVPLPNLRPLPANLQTNYYQQCK